MEGGSGGCREEEEEAANVRGSTEEEEVAAAAAAALLPLRGWAGASHDVFKSGCHTVVLGKASTETQLPREPRRTRHDANGGLADPNHGLERCNKRGGLETGTKTQGPPAHTHTHTHTTTTTTNKTKETMSSNVRQDETRQEPMTRYDKTRHNNNLRDMTRQDKTHVHGQTRQDKRQDFE